MRRMKKETNRIDWNVLAVVSNKKDRNNPNADVLYVSQGFDKHGFGGEVVVVVGKTKDSIKITALINKFCEMLINGEVFKSGCNHVIEDANGREKFLFYVHDWTDMNEDGIRFQLQPLDIQIQV